MRVVLANKFLYPKGGAERAVLDLGAELTRRGHRVDYFGMEHPDNAVPPEAAELVRFRDYHQPGWRRWRDAAEMLYSLDAKRRMTRLLRRVRPDVVHFHNIYHQMTPSVIDAVRDAGVPAVLTVHDYKLVCPRYDMLRHGQPCDACVEEGPVACLRFRCAGSAARSLWLAAESALHRVRASYDAIRLFLVPSHFLEQVLQRAGFETARLRWLPNFAPPISGPVPDAQVGRFLYAGRLSPEKGVETLVRAALALPRGELIICGDGPLREPLAALARTAPPGRIQLRGHLGRAALAAEMGRAFCTAVPSEWFENAPFAVLESMAAGRAVLASRIGGLPELVQDGTTGALLPPGDIGAWTRACEAALDAPERVATWGRAARTWAESERCLEAHVTALLAIYGEVAA